MSFPDLQLITQQNLKGVSTQLSGRPISLHGKPQMPPALIPLTIDWGDYAPSFVNHEIALRVDLAANGQSTPGIDAIRSIKIDNSYCAVPIYVRFPDTLDTVVCPAYSIVTAAVYTNSLSCVVYGTKFFTGRAPQTVIEFCNFDREGYVITDVASDSASAHFLGAAFTVAFAGTAFDISLTTVDSFAGGDPLLFAFGCATTAPAPGKLANLLFAGNALIPNSTIGVRGCQLCYFVPASDTPPFTFHITGNFSVGVPAMVSVAMFTLKNLTQKTPFVDTSTLIAVGAAGGHLVLPLPSPVPGGIGIFEELQITATFSAPNWSGATELASGINANNLETNIAAVNFLTADPSAVGADGDTLIGQIWI